MQATNWHDAGRVHLLIPGFGLLSRRYC